MTQLYTAIIVEPRKHKALSFVLNNILVNLSDEWHIVIYHGTKNEDYVKNIINDDLQSFCQRITLKNLNRENLCLDDYNGLLTSSDFYDSISTEMFLIFQTDTMIFKENRNLIKDFMHYDYVGAPWNQNFNWTKNHYKVGNGGFSLRRKSKMKEILSKEPFLSGNHEDVYFSHPVSTCISKPSIEKASFFSIETIFNAKSFGCHKPWLYLGNELFESYPEISILQSLQYIEE